MKHVSAMSKHVPTEANQVQDVICTITHALATFIDSLGGFSPAVAWLDDKCDVPEPNP